MAKAATGFTRVDRHAEECHQKKGTPMMAAAYRHVHVAEEIADVWEEGAPLWHGWGLHRAFLAGVRWAKDHPEEKK